MARVLTARVRRGAASEAGVGVPTALFVALVVFSLGATWTQLGIHDVNLSTHERSREQALNAAEAGVNAAMSKLTLDAGYAGGSGTLAGGTGEYEIAVEPIATADPSDLRRKIVATGYVPGRTDPSPVVRRLEAEVDLETTDGFDYGLFAGAGALSGSNHMSVKGDVYSRDGITLQNNSDVSGDVITPAWVTTQGNTLIGGDVRAGGDVTLDNSSTTVQGSVFSGGAVVVNAHVMSDVQAAGSITVGTGGAVDGSLAPQSPPPAARVEPMPQFTWDPSNYTPPPSTWPSAESFHADWAASAAAGLPVNGHHRIEATGALALDQKWKMDADVTVVSDGPVTLSREVTNAGTSMLQLVVISLSEAGIEVTNSVTIPDSIRVLLFAPNGPVVFRNLKDFTGAVYGESIQVDQNFTLTSARPDVPGFTWGTSGDVHHRVVVRVLREVAA